MKKLDLTIIIPTRNRTDKVIKTLRYLSRNNFFFKEIIIVDSSEKIHKKKLQQHKILKSTNVKIIFSKPSAAYQRNIGLKNTDKKRTYIMFLDDDLYFKKDAFVKMYNFIKKDRSSVGFGFNFIVKKNNSFFEFIKISKFMSFLGLYSKTNGVVTKSGWHTKAINLKKDLLVEWLPTAAVVYVKEKIGDLKFDTTYGRYSYLEDLDFSYGMKKMGKLVICSTARFYTNNVIYRHGYNFGVKEIINRYHFVKKFKLSKKHFFLGSIFLILKHILISCSYKPFYFLRTMGNINGILKILLRIN